MSEVCPVVSMSAPSPVLDSKPDKEYLVLNGFNLKAKFWKSVHMPEPEALARIDIDHLLEEAGWVAQDRDELNLFAVPALPFARSPSPEPVKPITCWWPGARRLASSRPSQREPR